MAIDYLSELSSIGGGNKYNPLNLDIPRASGAPGVAAPTWGQKLSKWAFGDVNAQTETATSGFALPTLSALAGIGNAYLGMKQYGLAKDSFKFQKKAWERDFAVQKNMINSEMTDRQNARVAANPGAHESTASYMSKWGVK